MCLPSSPFNERLSSTSFIHFIIVLTSLGKMVKYLDAKRNLQVDTHIGQPIFKCTPFAHAVVSTRKGTICDSCLSVFGTNKKVCCDSCSNQYYCSQLCLVKDRPFHQPECKSHLHEKIYSVFGSFHFQSRIPKLYLSPDDLLDYTQLVFRLLTSSQFSHANEKDGDAMETDQEEIHRIPDTCAVTMGKTNVQIFWEDLSYELDLNDELDETEEIIGIYTESYDRISEEKRLEYDGKLKLDMPDEAYFRDLAVHTQVSAALDEVIDAVVAEIDSNTFDNYIAPNGDSIVDDNSGVTSSTSQGKGKAFPKYRFPVSSSFKGSVHNSALCGLSYDTRLDHFNGYYKTRKSAALDADAIRFFRYNTTSLRGAGLHKDDEAHYQDLKAMYRMFLMDQIIEERANIEKKPLDGQFGFWIVRIKEILQLDEVRQHFGSFNWLQIVKAFYVAIRFSIAIPDVAYSSSIARAFYLPMTLVGHSCIPNTSASFDGTTLNLLSLPREALKVESGEGFPKVTYDSSNEIIYDPKLPNSGTVSTIQPYLPLTKTTKLHNLSFNFQFELFLRVDSTNFFLMNQIRLIHCECNLCEKNKSLGVDQLLTEQNERMVEFGFEELSQPDSVDFTVDYTDEHFSFQQAPLESEDDSDDYEQSMVILEDLGNQYGNYADCQFARKIQGPISELIGHYRRIFGFYNPKVSALFLCLVYANVLLLKNERQDFIIFYRYKFLHSQIFDAIDSLAITHGNKHLFIGILKAIHTEVHQKMTQFYSRSKAIIDQIEPASSWSTSIFSIKKCSKLSTLKSIVADIRNDELFKRDGATVSIPWELIPEDEEEMEDDDENDEGDENKYNPFMRKRARYSFALNDVAPFSDEEEFDEESEQSNENDLLRFSTANKYNDMQSILSNIYKISDFSVFRKV